MKSISGVSSLGDLSAEGSNDVIITVSNAEIILVVAAVAVVVVLEFSLMKSFYP